MSFGVGMKVRKVGSMLRILICFFCGLFELQVKSDISGSDPNNQLLIVKTPI